MAHEPIMNETRPSNVSKGMGGGAYSIYKQVHRHNKGRLVSLGIGMGLPANAINEADEDDFCAN